MKKEPTEADRKIAVRIKQMRADLGISGLDLANKIGVKRGAVGNWERGQGIKRENLQRIAEAYKISYEWLATGRGEMQPPLPPQTALERIVAEVRAEYAEFAEFPEEADRLGERIKREIEESREMIERLRPPR